MQIENDGGPKAARTNTILLGGSARTRACEHRGNAWLTPPAFVAQIRAAFGGCIDLDPATEVDNPVGARRFYTVEDDGLNQPWVGNVYVNPPYSRLQPWIDKAIHESRARARILMLVAVRTDAAYHQRLLRAATDVLFIRGRLTFVQADDRGGASAPAAFGSMLVGLGISTEPLLHLGVRMWYAPKASE